MIRQIKKFLKRAVALTAAVSLLPLLGSVSAQTVEDNPIIKVGLYYGTNALSSANLLNEVGSGFNFGYYDSSNSFTKVGSTDCEGLTIMKDSNMYLASDTYYETPTSSTYSLVGAYHVQLANVYKSFDEAKTAANALSSAFPAYINGEYRVRVDFFSSSDNAKKWLSEQTGAAYSGAAVVGASSTCYTVTKLKENTIIFEFDYGSTATLGIKPGLDASVTAQTWFKGYKYYGGFIYRRNSGNDLTVINVLDMQSYVKGVIPYEMSASWPLEALKAQALCARTYAQYCIQSSSRHDAAGFDLCNSDDCQVYRGIYSGSGYENIDQAVDGTAGLYVMYNGNIATTVYHSCDGGSTEDAANVWGDDYPYLKAVKDTYEDLSGSPYKSWTYEYTLDNFTTILQGKGYKCADIVDLAVEYTAAGNVYRLIFTDSNGDSWKFSKENARTILYSNTLGKYTYSQRFTVTQSGEVSFYVNDSSSQVSIGSGVYAIGGDGTAEITSGAVSALTGSGTGTIAPETGSSDTYIISGSGWGHNVGMSQYGAKAMALKGYTYDQIIKFYFTGVTIE